MPSWSDLRRYLKNNPGWECFKHTDHDFYRKKLPNGKVLITKVSRGTGEIGSGLWRHILKHELRITQEEFNAGL